MNVLMRTGGLSLAVMLAALAPARAEKPPTNLDEAFARKADDIVDAVRDLSKGKGKDGPVVGALNFQVEIVQGRDHKPSFKVGPINAALAERTEVVLLLGQNEPDLKKGKMPLRVIRNANATVAAKNDKIDHTTAKGREAVFALKKYPLWTHGDPVPADLFLTGKATIDLEKGVVTVRLLMFNSDSKELTPLKCDGEEVVIKAPITRDLLSEAGQNFSISRKKIDEITTTQRADLKTRGAFDDRLPDNYANQQVVKLYKDGPKPDPEQEQYVKVTLFTKDENSGKEIELKLKEDNEPGGGGLTIKDLPVGKRVYIRLTSQRPKERLAVLVQVNGVSTLSDDKRSGDAAPKWVLEPGALPMEIDGFYTADAEKNVEPFVVVPDDPTEVNTPLGTITYRVWVETGLEKARDDRTASRGITDRKLGEFLAPPKKSEDRQKELKTIEDAKAMIRALNKRADDEGGFRTIGGAGKVEKGSDLKKVEFVGQEQVESRTVRYQ